MKQCEWCGNKTDNTVVINKVELPICCTKCKLEYLDAISNGKVSMPEKEETNYNSVLWFIVIVFVIVYFLNK